MNTGTVRVARVRAILIAGLATAAVALTGCTGGGSRPASAAQPAVNGQDEVLSCGLVTSGPADGVCPGGWSVGLRVGG